MTLYVQPYTFRSPRGRMLPRWMPVDDGYSHDHSLDVNVREEEDTFILSAMVPGLKADELSIQVLDDVVRIEGEHIKDEAEYLMQELPTGSFHRTLRLPAALDAEKVDAKIDNGVLTLRLPKAESAKPKKITVISK
ncbi:MAG: hypothetical protein A2Y54_09665 [Chloroflexi bacterium RBG_16_51_16]|nr:MAG: hypothetical protein A2Y54_09665 [Chloroflexi bacterium RBG_16_51_16]